METTFTKDQQQEIDAGIREGLDVSIYAKPEFLGIQMHQIRLGLKEGLAVDRYAGNAFDWFQMEEIRLGLREQLDIDKYADPQIPFEVMRQIRKGLEDGFDLSQLKKMPAGILREVRYAMEAHVDISPYVKQGYVEEQLKYIRHALERGLDIDPYINVSQRGLSIREIELGMEKKLDVSLYAGENLNWQQMREIRLGLEERLDVSLYKNPLYSWKQMKEIRLGMLEGLPVDTYANLMYTAKEMEKHRLALEEAQKWEEPKEEIDYENVMLLVSDDRMEAYVLLLKRNETLDKRQIYAALEEQGIVYGIDEIMIDTLSQKPVDKEMLVIARGSDPSPGRDGYYEYFFETDFKRAPVVLEDGSVDYQNIKWFETVKKDQKIACYHGAAKGTEGRRINGEPIPAKMGSELPPLQGQGFYVCDDGKTYLAEKEGKIELTEQGVEITELLVLEDLTSTTGNISFNGSVFVRGTISNGVSVKATGDILVDGFIESAFLESGGDIMLRNGCNAGGRGHIQVDGNVEGPFFENVDITAGDSFSANYCLNCNVNVENHIRITGRVGALYGGSIHAGQTIESYNIGNKAGVPTQIFLGKTESILRRISNLRSRAKEVNRELQLLRTAYDNYKDRQEEAAGDMFIKLESAIYTKEQEDAEITQDISALNAEVEKEKRNRITVHGTIYAGVSVNINGYIWQASEMTRVMLKRSKDNRIAIYRDI